MSRVRIPYSPPIVKILDFIRDFLIKRNIFGAKIFLAMFLVCFKYDVIKLKEKHSFLYQSYDALFSDDVGNKAFKYGDNVFVTVPANTVMILKITPKTQERLSGLMGSYSLSKGVLAVKTLNEAQNYVRSITFDCMGESIEKLTVNGKEMPFVVKDDKLFADMKFGDGSDIYLANWRSNGAKIPLLSVEIDNCDIETEFFLSEEVLNRLKKYEQLKYLEEYAQKFGDGANGYYVWSLPYKLFIVLPFTDAEETSVESIKVNGKTADIKQFTCWAISTVKRSAYFADITELVKFGSKNKLTVNVNKVDKNRFMGAYLSYADMPLSQTVYPISEKVAILSTPLSCNPPLKKSNDKQGVKIISAKLSDDFKEHSKVTLFVRLNANRECIKKVFCRCPITIDGYSCLTMNTDRELIYNADSNQWEVTFIIGERRLLIIDDAVIHIRAVDKNDFADDCVLPVIWKFK